MLTNLFSSFDPMTSNTLSLNWISMFMPVLFLSNLMFNKSNRWSMMENSITSMINKEFKSIKLNKQAMTISISIFFLIFVLNLMSLFPYNFTPTSHLSVTLALALPIWSMIIIYMILNSTKKFFSHMLPLGTPLMLMPFMILIETIGMIIRPISLSVRLMANLTAGHLIMTLLGNNLSLKMMPLILMIQFTLMLFESAISIIQAYVFSTISMLYSSET
nr:ATP synthase F0 subunit 6 [Kinnaridae sp.]